VAELGHPSWAPAASAAPGVPDPRLPGPRGGGCSRPHWEVLGQEDTGLGHLLAKSPGKKSCCRVPLPGPAAGCPLAAVAHLPAPGKGADPRELRGRDHLTLGSRTVACCRLWERQKLCSQTSAGRVAQSRAYRYWLSFLFKSL